MQLIGSGFIVEQEKAEELGLGSVLGVQEIIKPYRNGRDLTESPRGVLAVDLFGFSENEVRSQFPSIYQHLINHVKPERDQNNRESYRKLWWIFGEPRKDLRPALRNLSRYIATVETSKHRTFQFLDASVLPDNKLVVIAVDDAYHLGTLSSRIHVVYSLAAGSWLGVGNDPVYAKSRCFDPFPFPDCNEATKERIRKIAEELDAHRKRVQAKHPGLTLTGMYNVLEKLRAGESLTAKEKDIHERGLVSVLKQLHEELDAAVFEAYGWPRTLTDEEILERLVALNAERAEEEKRGHIRWLRPEYQNPAQEAVPKTGELGLGTRAGARRKGKGKSKGAGDDGRSCGTQSRGPKKKAVWPKTMAEQVTAVEAALKAKGKAVTAEELTKHFARAKAQVVHDILDTLCALGRAHKKKGTEEFTV
jgi:hypothetical protein